MRHALAAILVLAAASTSAFALDLMQPAGSVRVATFNASMNRDSAGQLFSDLSSPGGSAVPATDNRIRQLRTNAEIIQRTGADILLLNEFDYDATNNLPALFQANYLDAVQNTLNLPNAASPINYGFRFTAPSNTGIATGFDLNNNGTAVTTPGAAGYGDDSFGFGNYPGQFGMAVFSKHPILVDQVRTFQTFKWKDMPGNLLTNDPTPGAGSLSNFYSPEEVNVLRLSSKSHWDVPINVNGTVVHLLVSHPTPPTFDGPEDRNGKRNHDEIRFWKDYVTGDTAASYIYDDQGNFGGLAPNSRFVIAGDQNADPNDGDSFAQAIRQLLNDPRVDAAFSPSSPGGTQQSQLQGNINVNHLSTPAYDTADFADGAPGNLRADYVLPSAFGLDVVNGGVFWPENTHPLFPLVGTFGNPNLYAGFPSSDHRLVFVDVLVPEPASLLTLGVGGLVLLARRRGKPCR